MFGLTMQPKTKNMRQQLKTHSNITYFFKQAYHYTCIAVFIYWLSYNSELHPLNENTGEKKKKWYSECT